MPNGNLVALLIEHQLKFYKLVTYNRVLTAHHTCETINKSSKSKFLLYRL